jgi:predicted acylesterase/phospholipase RssA
MQIRISPYQPPTAPARTDLKKTVKEEAPKESFVRSQSTDELAKPGLVGRGKAGLSKVRGWMKTGAKVGQYLALVGTPLLGPLLQRGLQRLVNPSDDRPTATWLAEERPEALRVATDQALRLASPKLEESVGLNPTQLLSAQRALDSILAPQETLAGKTTPAWMKTLATPVARDLKLAKMAETEPSRAFKIGEKLKGVSRFPALVFLGEDKAHEAQKVMAAFNSSLDPLGPNPFEGTDLEPVWNSLAGQCQNKDKLPVYVDLDGEKGEMTATESIVSATLASLTKRGNSGGDDSGDLRTFFLGRHCRTQGYYEKLGPWIQQKDPEVAKAAEKIKQDAAPHKASLLVRGVRALVGEDAPISPFYSAADPKKADRAHRRLMDFATPVDQENPSVQSMTRFADLITGLDRDLATGVQTQWVRLLRNLEPEQRKQLFGPLAKAWVSLNTLSPEDPGFTQVTPPGSPKTDELAWDPVMLAGEYQTRPEAYDRSLALGQAIDHMLDGLGIKERRDMIGVLAKEISQASPKLQKRDDFLQDRIDGYQGMDSDMAVSGKLSSRDVVEPLALLGNKVRENQGVVSTIARRHQQLMAWSTGHSERYMSVESQLDEGIREAVKENGQGPLGVGEFYIDNGVGVTPLRNGPQEKEVLGQGDGEIGVSVVLEGGGGKGMAYIESLAQLKESFSQSENGKFAIDEYVGTSAGALTAGLLAAGFDTDELAEVMKQIDFKEFYSDYIWKQGGVDPRARGLDRGGIFSMQQMYQTMYDLISKKVGVEGRPILMSDLPFKLKVVTSVLNTDLPQGDPLRDKIDKDGRLVLSSEETPNVDVVAAMLASSAVPGFFEPPQMTFPDHPDGSRRIQYVDGGVVDNFPVAEATATDRSALLVWPVGYEGLSTLDFAPPTDVMQEVDRKNREFGRTHGAATVETLQRARLEQGVDRVVVGLNLAGESEQTLPILQGRTESQTADLVDIAGSEGLQVTDPQSAQGTLTGLAGKDSLAKKLGRFLVNVGLDGPEGSLKDGKFRPAEREARGLSDILSGVASAALTKDGESRIFQQTGE